MAASADPQFSWLGDGDDASAGVAELGVAELMVNAFWELLEPFGAPRGRWIAWTAENLSSAHVLTAWADGALAGAIAYSPPGQRRALTVALVSCVHHFGPLRGVVVYRVMRREFATPLKVPNAGLERDCYIELLAVEPALRRRGIGSALIAELEHRLSAYATFVLEVDGDNDAGQALYRSLGFAEVARYPEPWAASRRHGTMERVYLRRARG